MSRKLNQPQTRAKLNDLEVQRQREQEEAEARHKQTMQEAWQALSTDIRKVTDDFSMVMKDAATTLQEAQRSLNEFGRKLIEVDEERQQTDENLEAVIEDLEDQQEARGRVTVSRTSSQYDAYDTDLHPASDELASWPWQKCKAREAIEVHTNGGLMARGWTARDGHIYRQGPRCDRKKNHNGHHFTERAYDSHYFSEEY